MKALFTFLGRLYVLLVTFGFINLFDRSEFDRAVGQEFERRMDEGDVVTMDREGDWNMVRMDHEIKIDLQGRVFYKVSGVWDHQPHIKGISYVVPYSTLEPNDHMVLR